MIAEIIYLVGVILAAVVLVLLGLYYKNVEGENIEDFPAAILLCIGSWVTVILMFSAYKEPYKYIFKNGFKKK